MKRVIFWSLFVFFLASGCENEADIPRNEIVYASTRDIRDIHPHLYSGEIAAQTLVFEPLVKNSWDGIQPALAEDWEISPDGLEYTFYLRKDVTFTDGEPFNAHVVKKNIDAVLSNRERHAWLELVHAIQEGVVVDEYTYKLVLHYPYYPTLTELGLARPFRFLSPNCFIDRETKDGIRCHVGTGPFILDEHVENQYARFVANDNYWGEQAKVDAVKWRVMPDDQTILLALEKGEIDLIFGSDGDMIDIDSFHALEEAGKYVTKLSEPIATRALLLNSNRAITGDVNVREALQYAIDKETLAEDVLNGVETAADTLFAKTIPYSDIPLEVRSYDQEKAMKLLDKAGWHVGKDGYRYKDGNILELSLYYNASNAQERTISEFIQHEFRKVGVKLNIIGEEKQAFNDREKSGAFDVIYSLTWGVPYDPQSYVSSWRIPAHGDYQAQLGLDRKEWLDAQIANLFVETDEEKRKRQYEEILTYIHNEHLYVPLTYLRTKVVHVPELKGVEFALSQYEIPFENMYFSEE